MSEMRRAARALVERRTESFESRHDSAISQARLEHALDRAGVVRDGTFETAWRMEGPRAVLDATFLPSRRALRLLNGLSLGMVALIAVSVWVVMRGGEGAERFLLPLFAVLAIVALPFVTLGLSSAREAREARIRRAIRIALRDEEERFPPPQKWADEE